MHVLALFIILFTCVGLKYGSKQSDTCINNFTNSATTHKCSKKVHDPNMKPQAKKVFRKIGQIFTQKIK